MIKELPDKWIRKALYDTLNGIEVNGFTIPLYDYRVTLNAPDHYILITTQSNQVDTSLKCGHRWENITNIEVFTTYQSTGNTGSRLLADEILNMARELTQNLQLDPISNLEINKQDYNFPNDLATITQTENIYRKFITLSLQIN